MNVNGRAAWHTAQVHLLCHHAIDCKVRRSRTDLYAGAGCGRVSVARRKSRAATTWMAAPVGRDPGWNSERAGERRAMTRSFRKKVQSALLYRHNHRFRQRALSSVVEHVT